MSIHLWTILMIHCIYSSITVYSFEFAQSYFRLTPLWEWFAQSWIRPLSIFLHNPLHIIKFALKPEGEKGKNKTGAKFSLYKVCHVVDLKHGFVTSWENVLFTLENIGTCVKLTWNYFPCLVLRKEKVFIDYAQGLVQLLLWIFTSMISFLHCYLHERRQSG